MSFANPILFALGFAFVALPIVLHFLRRRRPPVMWGAMRFLVEAYRRRRRRMTLEQLLLLLCRCALVIVVALLIGRPIFGGSSESAGPRDVFVLVDNSIASERRVGDGSALDALKARAADLLDGLDPAAGDRAALITLAGPAQALVYPPSGDIAAVRRLLMAAQPRASRADLDGALRIVGEADADAEPAGRTVAVFSELRLGSIDPDAPLPPVPASIERLIVAEPAQDPAPNVAITEVEPLRSVVLGAGRVSGQARVTLVRSRAAAEADDGSAAPAVVELWAFDGARLGRGEVRFDPGQQDATGLVPFEVADAGADDTVVIEARLTAEGDTLATDNVRRRPIGRRASLTAGVIARRSLVGQAGLDRFDAADWVRLALAPSADAGAIRVVDIVPSGVDAPRLSSLDAAVLLEPDAISSEAWQDLRGFVDRGGMLIVTPAADEDAQLWTDAFLASMDLGWTIDRAPKDTANAGLAPESVEAGRGLLGMLAGEFADLSAGVSIARHLPIDPGQSSSSVELRTDEGEALLVEGSPESEGEMGAGLVVYLAVPPSPSWTNLPTQPLMVPLVQELVRQGVGRARGSAEYVAGRVDDLGSELRPVDSPGAPVSPPVRDAGVFELADVRGGSAGIVAVNPDTEGSRLDPADRVRLEAWLAASAGGPGRLAWLDTSGEVVLAGGGGAVAEAGFAGRLSLWLAAIALALGVVESLLARVASRGAESTRLAEGVA